MKKWWIQAVCPNYENGTHEDLVESFVKAESDVEPIYDKTVKCKKCNMELTVSNLIEQSDRYCASRTFIKDILKQRNAKIVDCDTICGMKTGWALYKSDNTMKIMQIDKHGTLEYGCDEYYFVREREYGMLGRFLLKFGIWWHWKRDVCI